MAPTGVSVPPRWNWMPAVLLDSEQPHIFFKGFSGFENLDVLNSVVDMG